jgi:hypothetical protein
LVKKEKDENGASSRRGQTAVGEFGGGKRRGRRRGNTIE